jgi:hypothetical protein
MDEIEVTARFDAQGVIIPLDFEWRGRTYKVDSIGRSWNAKDGYHILVMDRRNQAFHLIFKPGTIKWYLLKGGEAPAPPRV